MTRTSRRTRPALRLEALEARELMTISPGGMWPLNEPRPDNALVVKFQDGLSAARESAILNPIGAFVAGAGNAGETVVEVGQGVDLGAARQRLAAEPGVVGVSAFAPPNGGGAVTAASAPAAAAPPTFGVNLNANTPSGTTEAWVDVANLFQAWGQPDAPWRSNKALRLTPAGYPLADAGTLAAMNDYPSGDYTLAYHGTGQVRVWGIGRVVGAVTTQGGYDVATVKVDTAKSGILNLTVRKINASDPVRDIHLYAPGYGVGTTQVFTNDFLNRLQPFSSIRLMDWLATNGNTVVNWADRTTPGDFLQTGDAGVSWESVAALANESGKDIWVNVPVSASDDYVKNLADFLRDQVRPDVTIRVEYSNELWNGRFQQDHVNAINAAANPLLDTTDPTGRAAEQAAYRAMRISNIFGTEFGAQASRFQVVFAGQATASNWVAKGLAFIQRHYGDPRQFFGGIAVAPYVYLDPRVDRKGLTLQRLFASMNADLAGRETAGIVAHAALSARYGLPLLAYEGGQSLVDWNPRLRKNINGGLKRVAQNDPRMGQLYRSLDTVWRANGGGLFSEYSYMARYGRHGSWGLLQEQSDPGSVKWDTVMSLALPAGDATLDHTVGYDDFLILKADCGKTNMWWQQGDFNGDHVVNKADFLLMRPNLPPLTAAQAAVVNAFAARIGA